MDEIGGDPHQRGLGNWGGGTLPPLETTAVRTVGKGKGKGEGKGKDSTPGITLVILKVSDQVWAKYGSSMVK